MIEFLPELFLSWESKFPQMPSFDEINLSISWESVDLIRMFDHASRNSIRMSCDIGFIVPNHERILLTCQPSLLGWKLN